MNNADSETKVDRNSGWVNLNLVQDKLITLFREILAHPGFGELRVDVKILRKEQKEVVFSCGKQYRFVLKPVVLKTEETRSV
jgi:hypothetical protein